MERGTWTCHTDTIHHPPSTMHCDVATVWLYRVAAAPGTSICRTPSHTQSSRRRSSLAASLVLPIPALTHPIAARLPAACRVLNAHGGRSSEPRGWVAVSGCCVGIVLFHEITGTAAISTFYVAALTVIGGSVLLHRSHSARQCMHSHCIACTLLTAWRLHTVCVLQVLLALYGPQS
jgi:hypothetical protein